MVLNSFLFLFSDDRSEQVSDFRCQEGRCDNEELLRLKIEVYVQGDFHHPVP